MKKAIRHISILLLAGTVLLGATGVSIHQLYCYCKGEMVASIFKPDDPCGPELPKCCKGTSSEKMVADKAPRDCSDCTTKYVKLDVEYLLFSVDFKLSAPLVLAAAKCFSEGKTHIQKTPELSWELDLPPPPFGKTLLPHIQSFLC